MNPHGTKVDHLATHEDYTCIPYEIERDHMKIVNMHAYENLF